jgi:hypothetical protein
MGDIFVWTCTVLQWNFMGRYASINPLGIHNLGVGPVDSSKIKYDDSKADSTGEKVSPKNMYANPLIRNDTYTATKDSIFMFEN